VSKAHSVAYRTLLLQALCIPTDEPDPDAASHERAAPAPVDPRSVIRAEIKRLGEQRGWTITDIADDFAGWAQGETIRDADVDLLEKYRAHLSEQP